MKRKMPTSGLAWEECRHLARCGVLFCGAWYLIAAEHCIQALLEHRVCWKTGRNYCDLYIILWGATIRWEW